MPKFKVTINWKESVIIDADNAEDAVFYGIWSGHNQKPLLTQNMEKGDSDIITVERVE